MRVVIKGKSVMLEDETGDQVSMTTDQLHELVRVLNASTREDGSFLFEILEFTV